MGTKFVYIGQAVEDGQHSKHMGLVTSPSFRTLSSLGPLNRFPPFLCQNSNRSLVVCTQNSDFDITLPNATHSLRLSYINTDTFENVEIVILNGVDFNCFKILFTVLLLAKNKFYFIENVSS